MGHKHSVRDTGAHFTIDQYTRQIKNDSANKTTIVQYDHNSERLTFELPLYVDGHAMTLCDLIEIHFINIATDGKSQNPGVYEVTDIKAEGEKAIFTWLISQEATQFAGSLNFFIVFKCTENGVTVYRWGTEIFKNLPVSAGMDNGEAVLTEYPDVLAQWKAQIFGAQDNAVVAVEVAKTSALAAIEAAGEAKKQSVLDSIPDEYEALSALADQNHRNKAGAILLDEEGESIVLNDASEYPLTGFQLFGKSEQLKTTGKNLLPNLQGAYGTRNGLTFTDVGNGKVAVSGTATANTTFVYCPFDVGVRTPIKAGTYTVSGSPGANVFLSFFVYASQETTDILANNGSIVRGNSWTFTIEQDAYYGAYLYIGSGKTANEIISAQLEIGSVATEYEPYSGGFASPSPEWSQNINSVEEPEITVRGKNLIPQLSAYSKYGITITENHDGTSTLNGTATNSLGYKSKSVYLPAGTYTLKCNHVLDANTWLSISNTALMIFPGEQEKTFTLESGEHWLYFYVNADVTFDNYVLEAQLEVGESATAFEPYTDQIISTTPTLPGIPVSSGGNYTDGNGQEWICDEVDLARGVYVQRIGTKVFDGSEDENWTISGMWYYLAIHDKRNNRTEIENALMCSHFMVAPKVNHLVGYISETYFASGNVNILVNFDNCEGGVDNFKTWLQANPITVKYVLATPIETPLSEAEINAFKALHTNKPNTTILNDAGAHMAVEYVADTKTYIDNKIKEMMEVE